MKNWDEYFLEMAQSVANQNQNCIRRQYGCVLVRQDHSVIATGYNGSIQGFKSCSERGYCWRTKNGIQSGHDLEKCYAIHAEQNALMFAAKHGVSVDGASCYVNGRPCPICLRLMIQAGIKEIIYRGDYPVEWEPYEEISKLILMKRME